MPFIIADRVQETSTTVGTGSFALAGAVTGYQTFDAVLNTADTTFYTAAQQGGSDWEVGIGTFTAPSTLARTTIISSSNGGSIVNFPAGTKNVFIGLPASKTNVNDQPNVIDTNSSSAALRITQTGSGNALLVEDSANPDSSPFVVNADGRVVAGHTSPITGIAGLIARIQVVGVGASDSFFGASRWSDSANAGGADFLKSRGTSVGVNGIVQSGDTLAQIRFAGDDGSAFLQAAAIVAAVDGTPGTNDMPGRLVFSTTADGASSPTERMRIDSVGQVEIGSGTVGAPALSVLTDTNTGIYFPAADTIGFVEGGVEAMRLDASGNALINTTTAVSKLTVNGDVSGTFFVNPTTVSANYTIPTNYNAMTTGPITVNVGITVTVPSGSVWTVI